MLTNATNETHSLTYLPLRRTNIAKAIHWITSVTYALVTKESYNHGDHRRSTTAHSALSMRTRLISDPNTGAHEGVFLPLHRVPEAIQLRVRHLGHLPSRGLVPAVTRARAQDQEVHTQH